MRWYSDRENPPQPKSLRTLNYGCPPPHDNPVVLYPNPLSIVEAGSLTAAGVAGARKHDYACSQLLAHGGQAYRYTTTSPDDLYSEGGDRRRWAENSIERAVRSRMELLTALTECEGILASDASLPREEKAADIVWASEVEDGSDAYDANPNMIDTRGADRGNYTSPANGPFRAAQEIAFTGHAEPVTTAADFWRRGGQEEKEETHAAEQKEEGRQEGRRFESINTGDAKGTRATRGTGRYHGEDGAGIVRDDGLKAATADTAVFGVEAAGLGTVKYYQDIVNRRVEQQKKDEPTGRAKRSVGENAGNRWSGLSCCDGGNRGDESAVGNREVVGKVEYGNTGIWVHGLEGGKQPASSG